MHALSFANIQANYGKRPVLHGISMEIAGGERIGLIGPNGAGKSTLLKAIAGIIPLKAGAILLDNNEIHRWPTEKRVNAGIGYLLQDRNIFPSLTARENLELAGWNLPAENIHARIDEIMPFVSAIAKVLNRRAGLLSGGERQCLALAMVLLPRPKILLLDEPISGLSPKAAQDILAAIRQSQSTFGYTLIAVEHHLRLLGQICNKVAVLIEGKIARMDAMDNVLHSPGEIEGLFFGNDNLQSD